MNSVTGTYMTMDATKPTDAQPKSMGITNYAGGPNTHCAGNGLFPVWVGNLAGQVVGPIKVTFDAVSSGETLLVRVWPDIDALSCNESYPTPAAQTTVAVPAGPATVTATVPNTATGFAAQEDLMVQISPLDAAPITPFLGRVQYDGTSDPSKVQFSYCAAPVNPASPCQAARPMGRSRRSR